MNRADHERIRALLDGELTAEAQARLQADAAADPALAAELQSQLGLRSMLSALPAPRLPESLQPRSTWQVAMDFFLGLRTLRLSLPAAAAAAGVLFFAGAWLGRAHAPVAPVAAADTVPVRFVFMSGAAHEVAVAGSFNGWSAAATPLHEQGDGIWEATVSLPRGEHRYIFRVDGAWQADPLAPALVPDGMGNLDAVIKI